MSSPKVLFMGTPDFAVAILDALVKDGVEIVGVVTAPDKPAGRGKKLRESDVKKYAVENSLNLIQPMNLKNSDFLSDLQDLNADLFVVVAFRMLPEVVWGMPPMGTINLHASLLPNYRGAAPIHRAILNGETKTGVSTFFIEKEIDTGEILEQEEVLIGSNETVGELYGRLMHLGASCTVSTVRKLQEGTLTGIPQNNYDQSDLKSAPKIFKEDGLLNFNLSAQEVHNHILSLIHI